MSPLCRARRKPVWRRGPRPTGDGAAPRPVVTPITRLDTNLLNVPLFSGTVTGVSISTRGVRSAPEDERGRDRVRTPPMNRNHEQRARRLAARIAALAVITLAPLAAGAGPALADQIGTTHVSSDSSDSFGDS